MSLLWLFAVACAIVLGGGNAQSAPSRARDKATRTLDAITIEGEIAVPQVLFITSRDFRRHRDGLDSKYRKNALEVARPTGLPTRLRIVGPQSHHKEDAK
jgi:hypothetical protein